MKTNKQTNKQTFELKRKVHVLFIGLVLCFLQSCTTEEVVLEREANKKNYVTSEKVSIENVLSVLKNLVILNRTETFKTSIPEGITQKSGEKPNVYFTKIVKGNEYTTYLLLLNSYSTKNPYFMYYVITQDATTEKVGYLKYIPDTAIPFIDINTFSGKIQMLDLKHKIRTESRFLNGQPQKQITSATARTTNDCTSSSSIITHYCGSDEAHSPGQKCTDPTKAYYEVLIVTTCPYVSPYDNSAPVPNEFINNSTGGGGGANVEDFIISFEGILSLRQKIWWDNYSNDPQKQEIITYLGQNPTSEGILFSLDMIDQMRLNFGLILDVDASFKSPFNIDKSTIKNTTPEGEKFNKLYDALKESPEFKKLFIAIFDGDQNRFNVKFEIAEHVYEDNDPTKKEVNATTSQDPVTKNLTIKINKQILIAGTTKSQTNIENAKTILHECIHAYLFVKANYPAVGNDIVKILNTMYPTPDEQHDFMYGKMIPTMATVLSEIRDMDMVTTAPKRAALEQYTMHPTSNPMTSAPFNWQDFYKNLILSGLDETSCFKQDFPNPSDALRLHQNYIDAGKNELDR